MISAKYCQILGTSISVSSALENTSFMLVTSPQQTKLTAMTTMIAMFAGTEKSKGKGKVYYTT